MQGILPYAICALLYAGLAVYFWRTRWGAPAATPTFQRLPASIEHYAVLVPLGLHTWLLAQSILGESGLYLGVGNAISAILWLTVVIYWLGNFHSRLDGLQTLVMPAAAVACFLPAVFPSTQPL